MDRAKDITDDGWPSDLSADLILKPAVNVKISVGPSFSRQIEPKQFVTNVSDPANTAFGGLRNVFARLDQHTLSMNTRGNATFTPNLTLEMFAQPFLASGRYTDLEEYRAPRSGDVFLYGRDVVTLVEHRDATGHLVRSTIDPDSAGPAAPFDVGNPDFNLHSLRGPPCCGGRTGPAPRCSSPGRRSARGPTRSATSISTGTGRRCSATGR